MDYIVTNGALPSQEVWDFAQTHGDLVQQIGVPFGAGYYARIYKVKKSE